MDGLLMGFMTVRPKLELQQSSGQKGDHHLVCQVTGED